MWSVSSLKFSTLYTSPLCLFHRGLTRIFSLHKVPAEPKKNIPYRVHIWRVYHQGKRTNSIEPRKGKSRRHHVPMGNPDQAHILWGWLRRCSASSLVGSSLKCLCDPVCVRVCMFRVHLWRAPSKRAPKATVAENFIIIRNKRTHVIDGGTAPPMTGEHHFGIYATLEVTHHTYGVHSLYTIMCSADGGFSEIEHHLVLRKTKLRRLHFPAANEESSFYVYTYGRN